jgi:hypothetical protein
LIVFANCLTALPVAAGYNSRRTFGSPRYRKTEQPNLVSAASFVARGTRANRIALSKRPIRVSDLGKTALPLEFFSAASKSFAAEDRFFDLAQVEVAWDPISLKPPP